MNEPTSGFFFFCSYNWKSGVLWTCCREMCVSWTSCVHFEEVKVKRLFAYLPTLFGPVALCLNTALYKWLKGKSKSTRCASGTPHGSSYIRLPVHGLTATVATALQHLHTPDLNAVFTCTSVIHPLTDLKLSIHPLTFDITSRLPHRLPFPFSHSRVDGWQIPIPTTWCQPP